ncbi:MAG: hypothetical protein WBV73_28410 [Phormidium sp.]
MKQVETSKGKFPTWESPFRETSGLLEFKPSYATPEFFSQWSFNTEIYGEAVEVDHLVVTFPDLTTLKNYTLSLAKFQGKIVEGPGIFPLEFCPQNYHLTTDLWIHLETILMPSGGLIVLQAPHAEGDFTDRFIQERGLAAVHHVAIKVEDLQTAALNWQEKDFTPLSLEPLIGDTLSQWFLRNSPGQIIELINRKPENNATFFCQNIGGLRLSETKV